MGIYSSEDDKRALSCERHVNIRIVIIIYTGYGLEIRALRGVETLSEH